GPRPAGRSVVAGRVSVAAADRAALIAAARRRDVAVIGYVVTTSAPECSRRNRTRTGREHVPEVAIRAAAKRFEWPTRAEGFDRLERVRADAGRFEIAPGEADREDDGARPVFVLSPDSMGCARGAHV